jgi:S1-C subfamily serine protease
MRHAIMAGIAIICLFLGTWALLDKYNAYPNYLLLVPQSSSKAPALVRIEGIKNVGSGTHIGGGRILTATHILRGGGHFDVEDQWGNKFPASVTFQDTRSDIAVLQIESTALIESREVSCRIPETNEGIWTTGNPLGQHFITVRGYVAGAIRKSTVGPMVFPADMTTIHGNSGGGVIAYRDGKVIGVVSMVMLQPGTGIPLPIGLISASSAFCPLLKQAGVM